MPINAKCIGLDLSQHKRLFRSLSVGRFGVSWRTPPRLEGKTPAGYTPIAVIYIYIPGIFFFYAGHIFIQGPLRLHLSVGDGNGFVLVPEQKQMMSHGQDLGKKKL